MHAFPNIIEALEGLAQACPDAVALVEAPEGERLTWSDVRSSGLRLSYLLASQGVGPGSYVAIDMGTCPAYVHALAAAAYGGFCLVALNERQAEGEKDDRVQDVLDVCGAPALMRLEESHVQALLRVPVDEPMLAAWAERAVEAFDDDATAVVMFTSGTQGTPKAAPLTWENLCGAALASNRVLMAGLAIESADEPADEPAGAGVLDAEPAAPNESSDVAEGDVDAVDASDAHAADVAASADAPSEAAEPAAEPAEAEPPRPMPLHPEACWQLCLPLYHVGGLQVLVRSVLAGTPVVLHRKFHAVQVLEAAAEYGCTHVSVVDKMLQDLLKAAQKPAKLARPRITVPEIAPVDVAVSKPSDTSPIGSTGRAVAPAASLVGMAATWPAEPSSGQSDANGEGAAITSDEARPSERAIASAESGDATLAPAAAAAGVADGSVDSSSELAASASSPALGAPAAPAPAPAPAPADPAEPEGPLAIYRCILLGGAAPNPATLEQAARAGAHVLVSYGMTETASHVCWATADQREDGMRLLPGYRAVILEADEQGEGRIALGGPGVFGGYLNARTQLTADGLFVTGDRGRLLEGRLLVAERTADMFVSGGENIYPEQIRAKLLGIPGVSDAFVFGAEDARWGRRPVAFVEQAGAADDPSFNPQLAADAVQTSLSQRLGRIYQPKHVIVVPELPRRGIGKVSRVPLMNRYNERIEVVRMDVWRVRVPLSVAAAEQAASGLGHTLRQAVTRRIAPDQQANSDPLLEGAAREVLVVRVTDWAGRTGVAEVAELPGQPGLDAAAVAIERVLAPALLGHVFLRPGEVSALFARLQEGAATGPCLPAAAALEAACWDLCGTVMGRSLRSLIGGRERLGEPGAPDALSPGLVPAAALVAADSPAAAAQEARRLAGEGFGSLRVAVRSGADVRAAEAVREALPQVQLVLDACCAFAESDQDDLRALDALGAAAIIDPLDPLRPPRVGPQNLPDRLARLQRDLRTPIALDASWATPAQLQGILQAHPDLRHVVVRVAKFGGIYPALEFCVAARGRAVSCHMGDAGGTGIGQRLHAAFAALPCCVVSGDLRDTSRSFARDVASPPLAVEDGAVRVNPPAHQVGLGCALDDEAVQAFTVWHKVYE